MFNIIINIIDKFIIRIVFYLIYVTSMLHVTYMLYHDIIKQTYILTIFPYVSQVIEQGSHDELMGKKGFYYNLVMVQTGH